MINDRFFNFLGLGARAGKLVYGAQGCDKAIKTGKAKLVILDGSASENTKKDFIDACAYYKVQIMILEQNDVLGKCLGKPNNKIIGIVCPKFAKSAMDKLNTTSGGENIEQN
ncbi:MAG: ribosomal L7Ae/L30e/S12e/Gadd45 family protein [Christensenellaceae bacterium]